MKLQELNEQELQAVNGGGLLLALGLGSLLSLAVTNDNAGNVGIAGNLNLVGGLNNLLANVSSILGGLLGGL